MDGHAISRQGSPADPFLPIGFVLLIVGLIGVAISAVLAFDASYSSKVPEGSIASDVADFYSTPRPGIEDPATDSDLLWVAEDRNGNIIWEGTSEEEWLQIVGDAEGEYQAHLRRTWLYPSIAIAVSGLLIVVLSRRPAGKTHPVLSA